MNRPYSVPCGERRMPVVIVMIGILQYIVLQYIR